MTGLAETAEAMQAEDVSLAALRLRRQRDEANSALAKALTEIDDLRRALGFIEAVEGTVLEPPKWLAPNPPKASKRATLMLDLSDMHFDEVVRPEEVGGLNAYNRKIAEGRLQEWCSNAVKIARHYLAGVTYDGVVLILGGDTYSGDIHEELTETNEDALLGSVLHWTEQLCAATDLLVEEFGKLHLVAVPGNHGRTTRKPRAKLRARTNFDWFTAKQIERHYAKDQRFTFHVSDDADAYFQVYGYGHLATHGDQAKGGSGIGGIWPPIMRLRARKAERAMVTGKPFHTMWVHHWHHLIQTPDLIVNGSMKGTDEYAWINNFGHEPPQQALAVATPEHGITLQAPVFCRPKGEKWGI